MFEKGDLVKLNFPQNESKYWKRWNGLDRGDLGVVLEELDNHKWLVHFPAGREEKTQAIQFWFLAKESGESKCRSRQLTKT